MKRLSFFVGAGATMLLFSSCSVKLPEVSFTGEKTALENQVLGTYHQIEGETWIVASTRSFGSSTAEVSAQKQEVLDAVQNRKFNKDDVDEFKRDKAVGENNKGFLDILPYDRYTQEDGYKTLVDQIVTEENRDRRVIFERVLAINQSANEAGLLKVFEIFAKLNYDNSEAGTMIQTMDGEWVEKPKAAK